MSSTGPAPRMAVHRRGQGPDLVLFHGGMGSWKQIPRAGHWSAYENAAEVNRLLLEFFSS